MFSSVGPRRSGSRVEHVWLMLLASLGGRVLRRMWWHRHGPAPILFFAKRSDLMRICPNHEPFKVQNMLMKLQ